MGRYSSGSEEEKKKRKKKKKKRSRSRSRSASIESRHSTKAKKSKKKKKRKSRSRSRSADRYRRSRSRSYGRRSRSRSRDRYRKRSPSVSRGRYSRSRSRDRRRRRSRSYDSYARSSRRSRSHDSYSRSSRRSRSYTPDRKSKKKKSSAEREDPCANIAGFADLTPSEQSKIRMHMALKAAAAADEKLKGDVPKNTISLQDSMAYSQAIQDIESSSFAASSFKSTRGERKEEKASTDDSFTFGTAGELRLDSQRKPILVDVDNEELAHPSLYTDPEEKLTRWIQKLATMRRKKLEGEALT